MNKLLGYSLAIIFSLYFWGCSQAVVVPSEVEILAIDGIIQSGKILHSDGTEHSYSIGMKDGRLVYNGKDYGACDEGDGIILSDDGRIYLNFEERLPK